MTRRLLALLAGVLLVLGAAIHAPSPVAYAAVRPFVHKAITGAGSPLSVRFGDGIVRLHLQLCERCGAHLSLEISLRLSQDLKVGPTVTPSPDVKVRPAVAPSAEVKVGMNRVGHHAS